MMSLFSQVVDCYPDGDGMKPGRELAPPLELSEFFVIVLDEGKEDGLEEVLNDLILIGE